MFAAIAAIITAIAQVTGTAMKHAAANLAGFRAQRDSEIAYNQQKDLAAYQLVGSKAKADSIIIVAGFIFLGLMILIMMYKKK